MDLDPYPMVTIVGRHSWDKYCTDDLDCFFSPRKEYEQDSTRYNFSEEDKNGT